MAADLNGADPILIAANSQRRTGARGPQHQTAYGSSDVLELCRIYLLDFYLKHFGKLRAFEWLQEEHERLKLNLRRSILFLLLLLALTKLLQSSAYHLLAGSLKRISISLSPSLSRLIDMCRRRRSRWLRRSLEPVGTERRPGRAN